MKYLFAIVVIIAIVYIIWLRPATAAIPLDGPTVIEAENMTATGATNRAVTDGWELLGEAELTETVIFVAKKANFKVIAKGDYAGNGWPIMEVKIGGVLVASITIDSATWKEFEFTTDITPGTHVVGFAFVNDFYEAPADRNFYMDKVTISEITFSGTVTLAWDANTENDLAGYKIHYGSATRFEITGAIEAWCLEHEPSNTKCVEEWEAICKDENDRNCHQMLFGYGTIVDVANVTEYTVTGLEEGKKYFLAATAYDTDKNESAFSKELTHTVAWQKPEEGQGLEVKEVHRLVW